MQYVIAVSRTWHETMTQVIEEKTGMDFCLINRKEDLTYERLSAIKPRYIFFPHWSYIIPSEIYDNFECVIFHMTDVPFGRGGSPLQNLIARGIYETKISAIKCAAKVDAGPVYIKQNFSLHGTAEEIYIRAAKVVEQLIVSIVENEPTPVEQDGEVVCFARRKPEDGNIANLTELEQVFDYLRMLDAEGYPRAFLETEWFRLEFQRPVLRYGKVVADVIITRKQKDQCE
ncbi:MAG: methionyl-tRNA formyltransferase [Nitrospirae bacterium]|nr:methionyl-tRNA formyltransferase [Nitrospirota bacterium]